MNYINNWITQLSGPLTVGTAALPVPGEALGRLALSPGVTYTLVVVDSLDAMQQGNAEILHIVGGEEGAHTLQRGREGTDARDWGVGAYVYCSITAATLAMLQGGLANALQQVNELSTQLAALGARVAALESGGGDLPSGALVDSAGNALVDEQGNYLTYGE